MDIHNSSATHLIDHARNVYSQFGEDGVIEAVLNTIGQPTRWCVEFGAWDGIHLSNTCNLIKNCDYSAVLIEANPKKVRRLKRNFKGNRRVVAIEALVGFENDNNLDVLLSQTEMPKEIDLLSIDIDGNDYHVWDAADDYRPRVVVIEFNPTIPNSVEFVQPRDMNTRQGSSIRALAALGKRKGYELVACTAVNGILVDGKYFDLFNIADNSVETLRRDESLITHMFQGFDGTIFIDGNRRLVWHDAEIDSSKLQLLPKWLRRHPDSYGRWTRRLMRWRGYLGGRKAG